MIFLTALQIAGLVPLAIGLLVCFHVARPQHRPADTSNRINKIRLIWLALNREEIFTERFPWLKNDELKNVS